MYIILAYLDFIIGRELPNAKRKDRATKCSTPQRQPTRQGAVPCKLHLEKHLLMFKSLQNAHYSFCESGAKQSRHGYFIDSQSKANSQANVVEMQIEARC